MPCKKRKLVKDIEFPENIPTDYQPVVNKRGLPPGTEYLDISFTIQDNSFSSQKDIIEIDTPTGNKGYYGLAFGVKFPEIPPEEACSTSTDPLEQKIKVQRLYDVAIVEASVGKNCRHYFWTGAYKKGVQDVVVDDANKKMWNQRYQMSLSIPSGTSLTTTNTQNVLDAQKWIIESQIGKDYLIVVCQKNVYPQFVKEMEEQCGLKDPSHTLYINRVGWMRTCNKIQPIFSRYYRWVVDGSSTGGKAFNKSNELGYTDINYVEIGHYDSHDFNKRSTNAETTPNDIYTDGAIVGILGIHEPLLQCNDFDDSYFRMIFYYRVEEVKQSVPWLQNVTAFQKLTKTQPAGYQKRVPTFTENGEDMTHMTAPQKLATTSSFKVDIFSTIGEFYPVDTYQVKNDLTAATGKVYGPDATYQTITPGPSKN